MNTLNTILQRRPSSPLFHYSSYQSLWGIFRTRELWATKIHYLNDSSEFRYACDLFREEIARHRDVEDALLQELLKRLQEHIPLLANINLFVVSFSEDGDLLSQWRSYCSDKPGCSIGFSYDRLLKLAQDVGFWLVPCIYESGLQRSIVSEAVWGALNQAKTNRIGVDDLDAKAGHARTTVLRDLLRIAPMLKHPSFREEREWRLISDATSTSNDNVTFRPGSSYLIPYYRFPLEKSGPLKSIDQIIIGPNPHMALAKDSVFSLFVKEEMPIKMSGIVESQIPFRAV